MLKIAQYYDDFIKGLSEKDKEDVFQEGLFREQKNIKYIKENYEGQTDYEDIVKNDRTIPVRLTKYMRAMKTAIVIIFVTREVSEKQKRNMSNIFSIISKDDETSFWRLVKDYLKPEPRTQGSFKKLHNMWLNNQVKEQVISVGKASLHYAGHTYNELQIAQVKEALIKTEAIMATSVIPHFKEAFYGDILVIDEEESAPASYNKTTDTIWLRKKFVTASMDLKIHMLIHEIGHRYYKKVLNQKQKDNWNELYHILLTLKNSKLPQIGDSLFFDWSIESRGLDPGKDFIISEDKDENGLPLYIAKHPDHNRIVKIPLKIFMRNSTMFPSQYSQKNPEEFFCEALSLYTAGRMKKSVKDLLTIHFEHNFLIIDETDHDTGPTLTEKGVYQHYTPVTQDKAKEYLEISENLMHTEGVTAHAKAIATQFNTLLKSYAGLKEPWFIPKELLENFLKLKGT